MSIGCRSQSARTYLERKINEFHNCTEAELINHGLSALSETLSGESELNKDNISIAIVSKDSPFHVFSENENEGFLKEWKSKKNPTASTSDKDTPANA